MTEIKALIALRNRHGAHSIVGERISRFLQMRLNRETEDDPGARARLLVNMAGEIRVIEGLLRDQG